MRLSKKTKRAITAQANRLLKYHETRIRKLTLLLLLGNRKAKNHSLNSRQREDEIAYILRKAIILNLIRLLFSDTTLQLKILNHAGNITIYISKNFWH